MKEIKTDQRSRYTQMLIKKSFLKLSADKPINKITIAELCEEAGTNRITFYNHFFDIYDVRETIENDFYEEIMAKLKHIKAYDVEKSVIYEILLLLYRNIDFCTLLISSDTGFIKKVLDSVHDKFISEIYGKYKKIPRDIWEALHTFTVNGYVGLTLDWVKSGMKKSPEEMSNLFEELNKVTLYGIVGQYE